MGSEMCIRDRDSTIHTTAPHFDGVSGLLAATSLIMVFLTRPANQESQSESESSKISADIEEE